MLTNKKINQAIKYYEGLKLYAKWWELEYPDQPQALDMADVAIEALDALRWRDPVGEPPDHLQTCLVISKHGTSVVSKELAYYTANDGKFCSKNWCEVENVIAWIPFPTWSFENEL